MSVRNRVLPAGNQRVFGASVIASVMLFGVACHNGVETPISPSTTTGLVPTETSAALADDGETATTRGGPLSFTMIEMNDSGFSGTCTIGPGGPGVRAKASGQGGVPGERIIFALKIKPTPTDPNPGMISDFTTVDDKGNFRFSGERLTGLADVSGKEVYCAVLPHTGSEDDLARSEGWFTIP